MEGKYLLLGTNLGDKFDNLQRALDCLKNHKIIVKRASSVYESEPWGITDQPSFYNAVLEIHTDHTPQELLTRCMDIEKQLGRKRIIKWGERIIDIDILYFDEQVIKEERLTIPHPGIPDRRFTLVPLVELAPTDTHPLLHHTQEQLLEKCTDTLQCTQLPKKLVL